MNNMFEPLDDDELIWLDDFFLERIDDDTTIPVGAAGMG